MGADNVEYSEVPLKRHTFNRIDAMLDELLVEILSRLPCYKTATLCKSVCKRWAALLSQPYFMSRFVANRAGKSITPPCAYGDGVSKYDELRMAMMNDRTFGLVVRRKFDATAKGVMIRFNDPIYNPKNLSCSRLPRLVNEGLPRNLTVVGACNDLLLYQRHGDKTCYKKYELYLCNAQTKQSLALPSLNLRKRTRLIALICDPYYTFDGSSGLTINDAYRFCVVVIPYTSEPLWEFSAHLLSSSTGGQWRNVVLSLPLRGKLVSFCGLRCIGQKLYFHCSGNLIGFDPFVDVSDDSGSKDIIIQCHSIPKPLGMVGSIAIFGVFHEQVYACDRQDDGRFSVWVLRDNETGEWFLRHSIIRQDWITHDGRLAKLVNTSPMFGRAVGFHPANPDVIYVLSERWIILCNLATSKMEIAIEFPKSFYDLSSCSFPLQITLPAWPTPLPILVQGDNLQNNVTVLATD